MSHLKLSDNHIYSRNYKAAQGATEKNKEKIRDYFDTNKLRDSDN